MDAAIAPPSRKDLNTFSKRRATKQPYNDYKKRNLDAYLDAEDAVRRGELPEPVMLLLKDLIGDAGSGTYSTLTESELAALRGKGKRAIQTYLRILREKGWIRIERSGNDWRKVIVRFEQAEQQQAQPTEVAAPADASSYFEAAKQAILAGDHERAKALSYQGAMLAAQAAQPRDECKNFSPAGDDHLIDPRTINRSCDPQAASFNELNHLVNQQATACQDGGGVTFTPENDHVAEPDTPTAQALRTIGSYPGTIRKHAARPLPEVERIIWAAKRKQGVRDLPAFVAYLLDGGTAAHDPDCGKPVENPSDLGDDGANDKYIRGELRRYIIGYDPAVPGGDYSVPVPHSPPDEEPPDPDLEKYRDVPLPPWLREEPGGGAA